MIQDGILFLFFLTPEGFETNATYSCESWLILSWRVTADDHMRQSYSLVHVCWSIYWWVALLLS